MKKVIYSMFAFAMMAFAFTSCEDVPAPYDIPNGSGGGDPTPSVQGLPYNSASCKDWTAATPKGIAWSLGATYAKASGYSGGTTTATEAWLVSPVINTTTSVGAIIKFDYIIKYLRNESELNANHKLLISADYNGDVAAATWKELAFKPVKSTSDGWDFYASNTIQLPEEFLNKNVVVAFKFVCGSENSTTWEVNNFSMTEGTGGDLPGAGGDTTPAGSGTQADPFNVAAANQYIANGGNAETEVYVKGKISKLGSFSSQYGNYSYYISEDGTEANQFYVFRGLYLNKNKFTAENQIKIGDEVVICGKLVNYNGTHELAQDNYIVSLNGESGVAETGSYDAPYDVTSALTAGTKTGVYVKGYVVGYVSGTKYDEGAVFGADTCTVKTNLLIAASASERDKAKCMPVQLPRGDVRNGLNLVDNAANLGKEVLLYGNIDTYFNVPGVKSATYAEIAGTAIGTKP